MFYLVPLLQVELFLCLRYKVVLQTLALGSMACELYLCEIFKVFLSYQGSFIGGLHLNLVCRRIISQTPAAMALQGVS
jgi:hypothetical protein